MFLYPPPFSPADFSKSLTWNSHIGKISYSIIKAISMIYKIRHFVNKKIILSIYYSLIYPHLTYCIEVWGNADQTHLNRIKVLQKRAIRAMLFKDKRQQDFSLLPSKPMFNELKILTITSIFVLKIASFVFKVLYNQSVDNSQILI